MRWPPPGLGETPVQCDFQVTVNYWQRLGIPNLSRYPRMTFLFTGNKKSMPASTSDVHIESVHTLYHFLNSELLRGTGYTRF
jgi:hypothetical protein